MWVIIFELPAIMSLWSLSTNDQTAHSQFSLKNAFTSRLLKNLVKLKFLDPAKIARVKNTVGVSKWDVFGTVALTSISATSKFH